MARARTLFFAATVAAAVLLAGAHAEEEPVVKLTQDTYDDAVRGAGTRRWPACMIWRVLMQLT